MVGHLKTKAAWLFDLVDFSKLESNCKFSQNVLLINVAICYNEKTVRLLEMIISLNWSRNNF